VNKEVLVRKSLVVANRTLPALPPLKIQLPSTVTRPDPSLNRNNRGLQRSLRQDSRAAPFVPPPSPTATAHSPMEPDDEEGEEKGSRTRHTNHTACTTHGQLIALTAPLLCFPSFLPAAPPRLVLDKTPEEWKRSAERNLFSEEEENPSSEELKRRKAVAKQLARGDSDYNEDIKKKVRLLVCRTDLTHTLQSTLEESSIERWFSVLSQKRFYPLLECQIT
jgi:hypothetical protein